ncbi:MAG TPA: DNA-3-methyladenine glycosylase 2 family protein [Burkholderiales bacterium]|nr:DNA-3-methyladenine glycosylase 2 family protein [Burkholderiales bacterium]
MAAAREAPGRQAPLNPPYWTRACRELGARDEVLRDIIRAHCGQTLASRGDAFGTLARSIVGQQISVKAAASVWARLEAALGEVAPDAVAGATVIRLQRCGLSGRKVEYLQGLARGFADGSLQPGQWPALEDEALIRELTRIRGIGRWSAEMYLIFHMQRPDVLPLADLGLQRAMRLHYQGKRQISLRRMQAIAGRWRPWRTVATWYLWRSLDPVAVEY